MIALARYVVACCLNGQRWVAPGLVFVLSVVITFASGTNALSAVAGGATWLLPVTAWLTVNTLNDEDASQAAITSAAVGGTRRARLTKMAVAACLGLLMAVLCLAAAYINSPSFTANDLAAGALACILDVVGGVALGALCARPLISRAGFSVLAILVVTIADLIVPYAPPARLVLAALNENQMGHTWDLLALGAGEVVLAVVICTRVFSRLASART